MFPVKHFFLYYTIIMCGSFPLEILLKSLKWKHSVFEANYRFVFPDENPDCRQIIYKNLIRNVSRHAVEFLSGLRSFRNLPQTFEEYPYQNFLIDAGSRTVLEKMRTGGLLFAAHFGNYEALGPWLCNLGIPLQASFARLRPNFLNRILSEKLRTAKGKSYSLFVEQPRKILSILDEQKLFCLVADQDYRKPNGISSSFLGKPVFFNPLPGFILKYRPHTPVFVTWIEEENSGFILHAAELSANEEKTSESIARTYHTWLENQIKIRPDFWYGFFHRRFYSTAPFIY